MILSKACLLSLFHLDSYFGRREKKERKKTHLFLLIFLNQCSVDYDPMVMLFLDGDGEVDERAEV